MEKSNRPFLQLHTHDNIGSIRDCTASIPKMFDICKENNIGFASTNHGYAASFVQINKHAKRTGVKPVYGVEFYLNRYRDRVFEIREELDALKKIKASKDEAENILNKQRVLNYEWEEIKKNNHICILAKNIHGYRNIIDLHNIGTLKGFYSKPLITLSEIIDMDKDKNGDRGVIITSACLSGVIAQDVMNDRLSKAEDHALLMKEEFADDWYLEIQAHELKEQRLVNEYLIKLHEKTKIPLCIGTDSHYLSKDFSRSHEIFLLLQGEQKVSDIGKKIWSVTYETNKGGTKRKKLDDAETFNDIHINNFKVGDYIHKKKGIVTSSDKWDFLVKKKEQVNKVWMIESADLSFKTEDALREHAKQYSEIENYIDEAIECNKDIYEKIENIDLDKELKVPNFENADEILFDLCIKSLKESKLSNKKYIDRFKLEFETIKNGRLSSYFLLLKEIVDYAKENLIPSSAGRGSGSASLILFILGVTRIDPVKWNFNWERFLSSRKVGVDVERIRIFVNDKAVDYKPNDLVELSNGSSKKAKDLKIGDDIK